MKYVFMSFKPIYAMKIVRREKDCEVRTYFSSLSNGDHVLVYASSPLKAVLGEFTVEDVAIGIYPEIEQYLKNQCLLFDEDNWAFVRKHYLRSKRKLIIIKICNVEVFPKPVYLSRIKSLFPVFRPPMSYIVIDQNLYKKIKEIAYD